MPMASAAAVPVAPLRLELGSGYHPTPGFTHLDLNPNAPDVDIVGPAFPLDLPSGSVAEMRCVDVLEHLSYWDTDLALCEWSRVLAPDGVLYVQVPDAERIMWWFVNDPHKLTERLPAGLPHTPLAGAAWRLLGGHNDGVCAHDGDDFRWNAHYAMFSAGSLEGALSRSGLVVTKVHINDHPNICLWAVKS